MKRSIEAATSTNYDMVIIGGGIFGVCAAWDAVLRGYKVAIIERNDWGGGASANCFKMVHGGIRYIQHGDIVRLRGSCAERSAFLRVAPHLVEPLPIVIPTYGHGMKGKEVLAAGMYAYDLLTLDRNRGIPDDERKIKWSKLIGRDDLMEQFPGLDSNGLTGGALFCDGQMYSPPRLVLAFLRSAVDAGVCALNYAEAVGLTMSDKQVTGVEVKDNLSGDKFTINARCVINSAGPWSEGILEKSLNLKLNPVGVFSRDACFIIKKQHVKNFALALQGQTSDPDALLSRPARHLFIVPWRDVNLVGVWHVVFKEKPDEYKMEEKELQTFIDEVNWSCPSLELSMDDVTMWNAGLVPFGDNDPEATNLSYGKRSRLIDHKTEHGISGLVSLVGIRYTMGRGDAQKAVNLAEQQLGENRSQPKTDWLPVYGGDFTSFETLQKDIQQKLDLPKDDSLLIKSVAHNYGSKYTELQSYQQRYTGVISNSAVLKAEVAHAIKEEMAYTLSDVVFRRTDLATAAHPGEAALIECAEIMAKELGWDENKNQQELINTNAALAFQTKGS